MIAPNAMADQQKSSPPPLGPTRVALTVDGLPTGSGEFRSDAERIDSMKKILAALKANGIGEVYGFCNGRFMQSDPSQIAILQMWLAAKNRLGNHTYNHVDLNKVSSKAFIEDIAQEDTLLARFYTDGESMTCRCIFRYPFLSEGDTLEKREEVRNYLAQNHYRIADVTADYFDWAWSEAFYRCRERHDQKSIEWLKGHVMESADSQLSTANQLSERMLRARITQIILIHFNVFNADSLGLLLKHW